MNQPSFGMNAHVSGSPGSAADGGRLALPEKHLLRDVGTGTAISCRAELLPFAGVHARTCCAGGKKAHEAREVRQQQAPIEYPRLEPAASIRAKARSTCSKTWKFLPELAATETRRRFQGSARRLAPPPTRTRMNHLNFGNNTRRPGNRGAELGDDSTDLGAKYLPQGLDAPRNYWVYGDPLPLARIRAQTCRAVGKNALESVASWH